MRRLAAGLAVLLPLAYPAAAQDLVVGIKEAPPFVIKKPGGDWDGISIELWRHLADQLHLRYRFEDKGTVPALLEATAAGTVDLGIAALTVTPERRQQVDFTQPFYLTGLGVAVLNNGAASWLPLLRSFLSFGFLQAVLVLLGIALSVGVVVWLLERRANEEYGGKPVKGLTHGVWWSAVAMTQAGAAQGGPTSIAGRVVAVVWMIASIIALATFTAGITSALTTHRLSSLVRNLDDLRYLRTGAVQDTSTLPFLDGERIRHETFPTPQDGLRALSAGRLDALVYDRPLLAWIARQGFSNVDVLSVTFDPQTYAIALPPGSALRPKLDVAVLEAMHSDWWRQTLFRFLGPSEAANR